MDHLARGEHLHRFADVGVPHLDHPVSAGADEHSAVLTPGDAGDAVLVTVTVGPADVEHDRVQIVEDVVDVEAAISASCH